MAFQASFLYTSLTSAFKAPLNIFHDQSLFKLHLDNVLDGI